MSKNERLGKKKFSRRKFLKIGGFGLGATVIGVYAFKTPIQRGIAQYLAEMELPSGISDFNPLIWFEITKENSVILRCPKVEMGQGVFTGFALMAAEELDVRLDQIKVVPASNKVGPYDEVSTGGSLSTSTLYEPVRQIAATMREMLKTAAKPLLGNSTGQLKTKDGEVIIGNERISYAEIVHQTKDWIIPEKPPKLKPKSQFKLIGSEVNRVDLEPKVMGKPIYSIDTEIDGMLYAVTLKSPYFNGTLKSIDSSEAEKHPGVVRVINEGELVAVVAENQYAAEMGLRKLKVEWEVPKKWQQEEIEKLMTVGNGRAVNIQKEGRVKGIFDENPDQVITAEYRSPVGIHAQLEPTGAIANYTDDKVTVICGTQSIQKLLDALTDETGVDAEKFEIFNSFMGGGFGGRLYKQKPVDAVKISRIIGKPVRVFRTREEEFLNGYYRPNNHHVMKATIGEDKIEAIEHLQASDAMWINNSMPMMRPIFGGDFISANHCADIFYPIENRSASIYDIKLPFHTGVWRAVGAWLNCFPIESFMDELAFKMKKDPIAFRLAHLTGADKSVIRMRELIESVRDKSGWQEPKKKGTGRGFACVKDRNTLVANALEVQLIDGKVRVTKVTSGVDAGTIVNPEGARTQIEGCIMMGISAALYEELTVKDSQFSAYNYHQYALATLQDTPKIEIIMIEGIEAPSGLGEPPIAPIAPAIANAIFDLTGKRLRNIPLRFN